MIVLAPCGTGKTRLSQLIPRVLDLEDYLFYKDNFKIDYNLLIRHLFDAGIYRDFIVLTHPKRVLRESLKNLEIPYLLVLPEQNLKEEYLERLIKRDSDKQLIQGVSASWESNYELFSWETPIVLESNTFLIDILSTLKEKWQEELKSFKNLENLKNNFKKEFHIL